MACKIDHDLQVVQVVQVVREPHQVSPPQVILVFLPPWRLLRILLKEMQDIV